MVFSEYELKYLVKALADTDDLVLFSIVSKIQQVVGDATYKRYTLRNTDWCVENGKKSKKRKNKFKDIQF